MTKAFYFPEEAGLPVVEPGDSDLYIMEVHYNNPQRRNGKYISWRLDRD
jgi:hypothetical protein